MTPGPRDFPSAHKIAALVISGWNYSCLKPKSKGYKVHLYFPIKINFSQVHYYIIFGITTTSKQRLWPGLNNFLCSSIFPNSKDTRGPQMMDSFRSDLEICATHREGRAKKVMLFFCSIYLAPISPV